MKVIIAGSRTMTMRDFALIQEAVWKSGWSITEVVCGLAKGADLMGKAWADGKDIPVKEFPADWEKHKKAAGSIRNKQMADYADALIVFIWNNSRGSVNMLHQMEKLNKPIVAIFDGDIDLASIS